MARAQVAQSAQQVPEPQGQPQPEPPGRSAGCSKSKWTVSGIVPSFFLSGGIQSLSAQQTQVLSRRMRAHESRFPILIRSHIFFQLRPEREES